MIECDTGNSSTSCSADLKVTSLPLAACLLFTFLQKQSMIFVFFSIPLQ